MLCFWKFVRQKVVLSSLALKGKRGFVYRLKEGET